MTDCLAEELVGFLREKSLIVAAAESCTGGLAAGKIAGIPGASCVFWGSFVCYTADAKIKMLEIDREFLDRYGLVSSETASEMARRALLKSGAHGAFSVTGIAGPGGDGSPVPAGTVWIGTALKNGPAAAERFIFSGSRNEVRESAVREAIHLILKQMQEFF